MPRSEAPRKARHIRDISLSCQVIHCTLTVVLLISLTPMYHFTRTHARTHARTHTRTHARTRIHARTHTHTLSKLLGQRHQDEAPFQGTDRGSMTDTNRQLVPGSWSLVRERALTSGISAEGGYFGDSGVGLSVSREQMGV